MIAFLAALIEERFGYPDALTNRIGHPVIWIGNLIDRQERRRNISTLPDGQRWLNGIVSLAIVLLMVALAAIVARNVMRVLPLPWLLEALVCSAFLAQKGLRDAVAGVADALRADGVVGGRAAVSHIVGRDTTELDEAGIARAAIETLAENTSDGVIAPLFYLVLFGLPGIAVYKAINTADSMIGHRSERYAAFGWAAAKLDDLANFVPARLTAALFVIAAYAMPGASADAARQAAQRDAPNHASPNAGWPEAAMAGALGFGLGGPRAYAGDTVNLPTMGNGRRDLSAADIDTALDLYDRATLIALGVLAVLALVDVLL